MRHPGRVKHLVVISGYWPGGPTAKAALQANRLLVRSEFPMWAPVPIMHATDDPVASYEAAERAAGRIPGARLARVEKGGHLMLGPQEAIRAELAAFLETPGPPETRPAQALGPSSI